MKAARLVPNFFRLRERHHAPDFISARLHRSLDGTKVTMCAEWRSNQDYQAMRKAPGPMPYFQRALKFAKFESGMYEVVRTFSSSTTET
jgi:hypothetical protein